MLYIKQIIQWLYKMGILEYPYLDLDCKFGGFKPDTKVFHKKYDIGQILDYATYSKIDKGYLHSVFFDSVFEEFKQFKREYGESLPLAGLQKWIPCSELKIIDNDVMTALDDVMEIN